MPMNNQANIQQRENNFKKLTRRARRMVKNSQRLTKVTSQFTDCERSQYPKASCYDKHLMPSTAQIEPRTQPNNFCDQNHSVSDASHLVSHGIIQPTLKISKHLSSAARNTPELPWIISPEPNQLKCTQIPSVPLTPNAHHVFSNMHHPGPSTSSLNPVFNSNPSTNDLCAAFLLGVKWACMNQGSISGCGPLRP